MEEIIHQAISALKRGEPVLIFDFENRERETDIVFLAEKVNYKSIQILRKDAGGLICVPVHYEIANALGLPYLRELLKQYSLNIGELFRKPLPYDERSSFSITINHVKTFTGITDRDRALTISELGKLCSEFWSGNINGETLHRKFLENFRAPGHVFLLRAAKGLVLNRVGHTELSLALAVMGNLTPCTVIAEMLGDDGYSLRRELARKYAEEHGYVFVTGEQIVRAYKEFVGRRYNE